jgi:hypothetical protein
LYHRAGGDGRAEPTIVGMVRGAAIGTFSDSTGARSSPAHPDIKPDRFMLRPSLTPATSRH